MRPFLILRRPESHPGARREMDGASGCGGPVGTEQHLREKCPLPQDRWEVGSTFVAGIRFQQGLMVFLGTIGLLQHTPSLSSFRE